MSLCNSVAMINGRPNDHKKDLLDFKPGYIPNGSYGQSEAMGYMSSEYTPNGPSGGYVTNGQSNGEECIPPSYGQVVNQHSQYSNYAITTVPQNTREYSGSLPVNHQQRVDSMHQMVNNHPLFASAGHHQVKYHCVSNSSREMRNKAEKQRRDKLNNFIQQLSQLLELSEKSTKRQDKTSVLRLSANELRLYQFCVNLKKSGDFSCMSLPGCVNQDLLEELIGENMEGFLLIVMPNGKVVFVSRKVESVLGYAQIDLMGQSLFTITAPEDHDRLRSQLAPDEETHLDSKDNMPTMSSLWKRDFNVKMRRAGPKSEAPQYEMMRLSGISKTLHNSAEASDANDGLSSSTSTAIVQSSGLSPQILVLFVKVCRAKPLADRMLFVPKEEYVTRHRLDGQIVWCDQRISFIAGYLTDEVQGRCGFYYMHKDDMRFAMMALRQMYDKGETNGYSCYRLKSSTGHFIYLRSFGRLEVDDNGVVESFVCTNVLVDEKEGKHFIEEMKRRFASMVNVSLDRLQYEEDGAEGTAKVTEIIEPSPVVPAIAAAPVKKVDTTEDPVTVNLALKQLMQDLPTPESENENICLKEEVPSSVEDYFTSEYSPDSSISSDSRMSRKRDSVESPEPGKRPRLISIDSEPPELSPCMSTPVALTNGFLNPPLLVQEGMFPRNGNTRTARQTNQNRKDANCNPYKHNETDDLKFTVTW